MPWLFKMQKASLLVCKALFFKTNKNIVGLKTLILCGVEGVQNAQNENQVER